MLKTHLNIEGKFIALASIIILTSSFVANIFIVNQYKKQLYLENETRASLLTESTGISFTNTLLYQELGLVEEGGLMENYIDDLVSDSTTNVTNVAVYDNDGNVLATNVYDRQATHPDKQHLRKWLNLTKPVLKQTPDMNRFVVEYPLHVSSKRFGTLLMQFTRQSEIEKVVSFKRLMFLVSLGFAVFGTLLAFIVARTLAKPIKTLAGEMSKVKKPGYVTNLQIRRNDEIGELERGFVDMLNRLKKADEEKERQQKAHMQTEKLASIGTLVSGLAHEINNPLSGIRNCLRRIITRPDDTLQTTKYAKLMDTALLRIENIVKDLLNFSRKRDFVFQPANLNEIISTACNLVEFRLKKLNVRLDLKLSEKQPIILGDAQHLEQVFVNLLLNAIDATENGGKINVTTSVHSDDVTVEVSDTGSGIPPEVQNKIFDPFFTTKPVGHGTGLGLSVTKAIVEEHRGCIDLKSDQSGTTFRLTFPGKDSQAHSVQCRFPVTAAILAGGKSQRMGRNKALLEFGSKKMIEHVVQSVAPFTQNTMIICNTPEQFDFLNLPIFPDAVESCGPLAGIYTALQQSQYKHCLVVACDLPFLSSQLIKFLCEKCTPYDIFAFESEFGVEPLCAVYRKSCLPLIETQIEKKQYKVADLFSKVQTRIVRLKPNLAFYDQYAFFNVNTPDELMQAQKLLK